MEKKEAAVQEFEGREKVMIGEVVERLYKDNGPSFKAKVKEDVMRFLDAKSPRMLNSKYDDINNASVAVLNDLIEKNEAVRERVGQTLKWILEVGKEVKYRRGGAVPVEQRVKIPTETIKQRNKDCGVSEDCGLSYNAKIRPVSEDIKPILVSVLARVHVLTGLYEGYELRLGGNGFMVDPLERGYARKVDNAEEYARRTLKEYNDEYKGMMPPKIKWRTLKEPTDRIPWRDEVFARAMEFVRPDSQSDNAGEEPTDRTYLLDQN